MNRTRFSLSVYGDGVPDRMPFFETREEARAAIEKIRADTGKTAALVRVEDGWEGNQGHWLVVMDEP